MFDFSFYDHFSNVLKYANVKIFTNGKIQMTGLKTIDSGKVVVNILINELKKIEHASDNNDKLKLTNFQIVLINTDFKTNFKIKRPNLHKLLVNKYKLFSKYEPCI